MEAPHRDDPSLSEEERLAPLLGKVEACVQKLLEDHKDVTSEHGHWKKVKEKRGITVHLSHEEGNPIKAGKARGLIPGSPKLLLRILQSLDYYPQIDPLYTGGRVVDQFSDRQHEIIYASYSSGFNLVVSPRDFLYLEGRRDFEGDTKVIACISIERDDVPHVKGHVRGHIFESGWVIAPCQPTEAEIKAAGLTGVESDSWCDCLFLAQVDIKGWIPTWLVNRLSGELGDALHRLRKFIKEKGHTVVFEDDGHHS